MKLPDKIEITKDELKVVIAVIIFFGLIFWFFPRLNNLIQGKGFVPNEYTVLSGGFFGDE